MYETDRLNERDSSYELPLFIVYFSVKRKPPPEVVRGKNLRYKNASFAYNRSRSGNRNKSKGGVSFMANDNSSLSHTKWNCKYHIVFAPKYRRQEIYRQIKADIGKIIRQLCEMKKVEIIEAEA